MEITTVGLSIDSNDDTSGSTLIAAITAGLSIVQPHFVDGPIVYILLTGTCDQHDTFVESTGFDLEENPDGSFTYAI